MGSLNLLNEGATLMLQGMGFVFIFLTLLVIMTTLMSRLITLYEKSVGMLPEEGIPSPTAVVPFYGSNTAVKTDDQTLIAVFSAAIRKYRSHKP